MNAVSLFSGAGGMDVGFKAAGFTVVAANEIDKSACMTFRANHPTTQLIEGDIDLHLSALGSFNNIDVVFGGPPCQGFSVAGKMNPDDPRSKLIFSFCSVVENLQPRAFVMENVKALACLEKFEGIRAALMARFKKAGYSVSMHVLNAKDFGVPQSRERVFFIGFKQAANISNTCFDQYKKTAPILREILTPLGRPGSIKNQRICNAKVTIAAKPVMRKSPYAGMMFNGQGRPLNPDGWSNTLPASMGGNRTPIIDDDHLYNNQPSWIESYHNHLMSGGSPLCIKEAPPRLRRLTVDEAALIQTFPSDYNFVGTPSKVYAQIGNAVPCLLAKAVAEFLKKKLQHTSSKNYSTHFKVDSIV